MGVEVEEARQQSFSFGEDHAGCAWNVQRGTCRFDAAAANQDGALVGFSAGAVDDRGIDNRG